MNTTIHLSKQQVNNIIDQLKDYVLLLNRTIGILKASKEASVSPKHIASATNSIKEYESDKVSVLRRIRVLEVYVARKS